MKSICVFAGANPGGRPEYAAAAAALGREIAARGSRVVYGGGNVGLMGALADAVLAAGGEVIGVIPEALLRKEVAHEALTELKVVSSMHERKAVMSELSDGVVALPGGFGTLEELFEMLTWSQLGFHAKPCGVLNVCGYYDALLAFLDHLVTERFLHVRHRSNLLCGDDPAQLIEAMDAYESPVVEKWLDRDST